MWSRSRSALVPSSVTIWPFTLTRPCVINSSALRREVTPAAAMIFCNLCGGISAACAFRGNLVSHLFVGFVVLRIRRDGGFGHILRDFGFIFFHLLHAAIVAVITGRAGGIRQR